MIILEPEADPQKARLSRRHSVSSDAFSIGSSQIAPPSYRSNGSRNSVQPMLESEPPESLLPSKAPMINLKTKMRRRICKGLFYALALYAVVSIAILVPYFVRQSDSIESHNSYQRMGPPNGPGYGAAQPSGNPVVPQNVPVADGTSLGCNLWDYSYALGYPDTRQLSRLSYCIPHNSTNIWLHALGAQGQLVSGRFTVMLNPDPGEPDYTVEVAVTYDSDDVTARNSSAICLMQNNDTWGIGIYTPPDALNHTLDYQLTLLVPHAEEQLTLPQFTTYLPWFSHSFKDLNNSLIFGDVQIGGIGSPVDGTIAGQTVNVTTSLAAITGNYHASKTLVLQTSYAKIDTNITLGSTVGQDYPTSLYMSSSEGPFSATVNLSAAPNVSSSVLSAPLDSNLSVPDPPSNMRPQYSTTVSCSDSPVTLIFRHDDSVDFSDLEVQVNTTLNRAVVLLDSKFEGNFDLYSTNGSVIVADLDGDENSQAVSLTGTFPENYRRSLEYQYDSVSRAQGCVKRGTSTQSQKVNVQVTNKLALVALGFVKPGDNSPSIADIGLL